MFVKEDYSFREESKKRSNVAEDRSPKRARTLDNEEEESLVSAPEPGTPLTPESEGVSDGEGTEKEKQDNPPADGETTPDQVYIVNCYSEIFSFELDLILCSTNSSCPDKRRISA